MFKRFVVITAALLSQSQPSIAQVAGPIPQEMYWAVASRPIKINNSLPAACDVPTANAAATVNRLGVKFQLTGAANSFTSTYYDPGGDPDYINVQDASGMSAIMSTVFSYYAKPTPPHQAIDATVYVDTNRIYYVATTDVQQTGDFSCRTEIPAGGIGGLIDYESAMLHEFGHVMGMGHRTDGTTGPCVMTRYLPSGQIKRSFCSDEASLMWGFYGPR